MSDLRAASEIAGSGARRNLGSLRIERDLSARGVDPTLSERVLSPLEEAEEARLEAAYEARARTLGDGLTRAARSKKLFAFLVRRGFLEEAVLELLQKKGEYVDDDP